MSDHQDTEEKPDDHVTWRELRQEVRALRSDFKVWMIAAVFANQTLAHADFPQAISYGLSAVSIVGIICVKLFLIR